jgi:Family of unknown function (DUF6165)
LPKIIIMKIEVSIGEIADKYTILTIKSFEILDEQKQINIKKEWKYINSVIKESFPDLAADPLTHRLLDINRQLWVVEDSLRDCENDREFDKLFVFLARQVYRLNDQRADIKKQINIKYKSDIVEEKSYNAY